MDGPVSQANLSDLLVSLKQLIADEESEAADPVLQKKAERLFLDPSLRINAGGHEPAVERIVRTLSLKDKVAKLEDLIDLGAGLVQSPRYKKVFWLMTAPRFQPFLLPCHCMRAITDEERRKIQARHRARIACCKWITKILN